MQRQSSPIVNIGVTEGNGERYFLDREPAPMPRPRWWQSRWFIHDRATSDRAVIEKFWHFGAAEQRVRCLNGTASAVLCGNSAANRNHNERLALAS